MRWGRREGITELATASQENPVDCLDCLDKRALFQMGPLCDNRHTSLHLRVVSGWFEFIYCF